MPTILHKRSSTANSQPTAGQLTVGELAVNTADGRLYLKLSNGTVVTVGAREVMSNSSLNYLTGTAAIIATAENNLVAVPDPSLLASGVQAAAATPKSYVDTQVATRAASSHAHGNVTSDGKIGSTSGVPIITGAAGALQAGSFGTGAGQFAEGNHNHALSSLTGVSIVNPMPGQVIAWNSAAWANTYQTHAASDITSGTLDIARIPTGSTSTTVSLGNHNHALSSLTGVSISSPSNGQVLKFNGTSWVNDTDATGGGGSVTAEDDQIILAMRVFA